VSFEVALLFTQVLRKGEAMNVDEAKGLPIPTEGRSFVLGGVTYSWREVEDEDGEFPPHRFWEADLEVMGGQCLWLEVRDGVWVVREDSPCATTIDIVRTQNLEEALEKLAERAQYNIRDFKSWKAARAS